MVKDILPQAQRSEYSGPSVHKLDSCHDSGHKPGWTRTELNSAVKFSVDLMGKSDSILVLLGL